MRVTKLGHCCLLIEEQGQTILTDPGLFTVDQHSKLNGLAAILITHEHPDHLHVESVQALVQNNPQATIVTNNSVGKKLEQVGVRFSVVEHGQSIEVAGVLIEGFGNEHEEIYKDIGKVQNTGYFINNKLFYPGDAFTHPGKLVPVLALPVSGPWMRMREAIGYALDVNPKLAFPVHDGIVSYLPPFHNTPSTVLKEHGVAFTVLEIGVPTEIA